MFFMACKKCHWISQIVCVVVEFPHGKHNATAVAKWQIRFLDLGTTVEPGYKEQVRSLYRGCCLYSERFTT